MQLDVDYHNQGVPDCPICQGPCEHMVSDDEKFIKGRLLRAIEFLNRAATQEDWETFDTWMSNVNGYRKALGG